MTEHPLKGTILDVDLDGVCADFYGKMREIASEWFECPVDELPLEVTYGLHEWGIMTPDQYASLHRFAVTQRGLFEDSLRDVTANAASGRLAVSRMSAHRMSGSRGQGVATRTVVPGATP
jgi:5' nucleotidase, deoxy (Pyrimidine), cytosolic type C protein (NT5C)